MIRVESPKTSLTAGRFQHRRIYPADVVELLFLLCGSAPKVTHLWPASAATFRDRFNRIGQILGLPMDGPQRVAPLDGPANVLDLGGLRAGGATQWLLMTEDENFVQRQGGWLDRTSMNIYVQEFVSVSLLSMLPTRTKEKVMAWVALLLS